jgi:hypoxanthine phosphoribosyltransferase
MDIGAPSARRGTTHSVTTLNQMDFDAACGSLMRTVLQDYKPTLLVGVRTGGLIVAEAMARSFAQSLPVMPLTCRRPSTATKSRLPLLHEVLTMLPRDAVDAMRILEHRLFAPRRQRLAKIPNVDHAEAAAIAMFLRNAHSRQCVLVVDDAVDSGVTLATVTELLRGTCAEETEIRTAVVTVTLEQPRITPDYSLYHGVLCRFPWSFDAAR